VAVLCYSQQQARQVKARLAEWLAPRGLAFNEDKTRIVHLSEGFSFLGFNVRRYGPKLLIKPDKAAIRRLRERLASEMRTLRGSNAAAVIAVLNPIIRGWAAYYRGAVSSKVFHSLDTYVWRLTFKWARWQHRNKPRSWIVGRYFGMFNRFRNDRWVFGDRDGGTYLVKFSWTGITRHVMVKGAASPDDPALASYWADRRKKVKPPLDAYTPAAANQAGRAVPAMRGTPADRRSATPVPRTVGTMVAARHPQGNSRQLPCPSRETRPRRRGPNPPRARLLPPQPPCPHRQAGPGTATRHALAACLSRVPR
jgi:RNA-directed DNA polymerase